MVSVGIHAEISIVNLKGMTNSSECSVGVKQDYIELSPAVGALFWLSPFLKNIHRYGTSESSYTRLVKELFHIHVDGSFDTTRLSTKISYYFDVELIGKLIGMIFLFQQNPTEYSLDEYIKTELIDPLVRNKEGMIRNALANNYEKAIAIFQKKLRGAEDEGQKKKILATIKSFEGMSKKIKDTRSPIKDQVFVKSVKEFSSLISGAIKEELDGVYPRGLTINTLLAVLWKKAASKTDLKIYLDSVAATLAVKPDQLYNWPDLDEQKYTRQNYEQLKGFCLSDDESEMRYLTFDELIFTRFGYNIYENPLPPKAEMIGNAHYRGKEFSDCGETALRNFINALIYDGSTRKFDINVLKALSPETINPKIVEFYSRYSDAASVNVNEVHDAWAEVVSNLSPSIRYASGTYDIDEGFSNMMAVINALFPDIRTMEDIGTLLKTSHNIDVTVTSDTPLEGSESKDVHNIVTITIKKPDVNQFDVVWQFTPDHFELDFPYPDVSNFTCALSMQDKERMQLNYAFIDASFTTDYSGLIDIPILKGIYMFMLPLDTDTQKIEAARTIAAHELITEHDKAFVLKLSGAISRDFYNVEYLLNSLYSVNSFLVSDIIQAQKDVAGISVAIYLIITHNISSLYDWASNPDNLQIVVEAPSYLLETLLDVKMPEKDMQKENFLNRLFDWSLSIDLSNIEYDNALGLIQAVLDATFSEKDTKKKETIKKLYKWILNSDVMDNIQVGDAVKLISSIFKVNFEVDSQEKKDFALNVYHKIKTKPSDMLENLNYACDTAELISSLLDTQLNKLPPELFKTAEYLLENLTVTAATLQDMCPNHVAKLLISIVNFNFDTNTGQKALALSVINNLIVTREMLEYIPHDAAADLLIVLLKVRFEDEPTEMKTFIQDIIEKLNVTSEMLKNIVTRK